MTKHHKTFPCQHCGTDNPNHLCDTCVTQLDLMRAVR